MAVYLRSFQGFPSSGVAGLNSNFGRKDELGKYAVPGDDSLSRDSVTKPSPTLAGIFVL